MYNLTNQRLTQLKTEFESGQTMLAELETKQAQLRETLLRISGAIQVLEELLAQPDEPLSSENGSSPHEAIMAEPVDLETIENLEPV